MSLQTKIDEKAAQIAVIGLGYVGLPLAVEFARTGFQVTGIDVDGNRVEAISQGQSYLADVTGEAVAEAVSAKRLQATTDYGVLSGIDVIFICVPTPFDAMKAPDLSYIRAAAEGIAAHLRRGQLIILQSTTFPGTTEEVVKPLLERNGMQAGQDFYLAFSPERIDPGNRTWTFANTPKVVGGTSLESAELASQLFCHITSEVHMVSSTQTAEMTKLLENIFRSVNIALVNELALLSERMGIDFWEVVDAAASKPFGFMPFYPGPGLGGHCIPVDPYYLLWKAREYDFYTKFIELAAEVNGAMPYHIADLVVRALGQGGKALNGARLLVLGVAFKRDVDDARNSPAERLCELLLAEGAEVRYHDPYVPQFRVGPDVFHRSATVLSSVPLSAEALATSDAVVIVSGHTYLDYGWVVEQSPLVVDACNATKGVTEGREKIWRVGAAPGT